MLTAAQAALARAADLAVTQSVPLHGGDVSSVIKMGSWVLKTVAKGHPARMFTCEAKGLKRLNASGCATPNVRFASELGLVLDFYPTADANDRDYALFASQLAHLHLAKRVDYRDEHLSFLGPLPLECIESHMTWTQGFVDCRLNPMHRRALVKDPEIRHIDLDLLGILTLPEEGPCLIHGDLWQGNVLATEHGLMMIDPSCWIGERAVDIAMLRLFGNLPNSFWTHYLKAYPIPPQVDRVMPLYQLYYALAHVALFGSTYTELCHRLWRSFIIENA